MHLRLSPARWITASLVALSALAALSAPPAAYAQARRNRTTPGLVLETGARHATCDVLLFADGGKTLLATGDDKVVRSWDVERLLADPKAPHRSHTLRWPILRERRGAIFAMALSPDQTQVAVAGVGLTNGAVVVLDRATGRVRHSTDVLDKPALQWSVWAMTWAPSAFGRKVLYGNDHGHVILWDLDGKRGPVALPGSGGEDGNKVRLIAFPDRKRPEFLTVDQLGRVWRRNVNRPQAVKKVAQLKLPDIRQAALSADGRWLAACGENRAGTGADVKRVELLDLQDGSRKFLAMPQGQGTFRFPQCLAFSDSRTAPRLAVGLRSIPDQTAGKEFFKVTGGLVYVFEVPSGRRVLSRPFNVRYQPDAVAFRPGGRQVATAGGDDHEVRLWDVDSPAEPRATVRAPTSCLWGVGFGYANGRERYIGFQDRRKADPADPNDWGDPDSWRVFDLDAKRLLPAPPKDFTPLRPLKEADGWTLRTTTNAYVWQVVDPDGKATALSDKNRLWNSSQYNLPRCYTFVPASGKLPTQLVVGHAYGASVFELRKGDVRLVRRLLGHEDDVMAVAPSKSGKLLLTGGRDMTLACWSLVRWKSNPELGATFAERNGTLRVEQVEGGSPAWEMGLTPHDEVVLISAYHDRWCYDAGSPPWFKGSVSKGYQADLKDPQTGEPQPIYTQKGARKVTAFEAAQRLQRAQTTHWYIFLWKRNGKLHGLQLTTLPQRPLWRLFATRPEEGSDWVVWRWLDYFYDTRSGNADRLLGWHVNSAAGLGTPTFHPLERFRGTDQVKQAQTGEVGFHQPRKVWDSILAALPNPSPEKFAEIEPPLVRVTVANPGRKPDQGVTLSVTITPRSASPKQRLEKVLLWRDDYRFDAKSDELQQQVLKAGGKGVTVPKLVIPAARLRNGQNVLTVQCYNSWGGRGEASVTVAFNDPRRPRARLFALCVGVNEYKSARPANPDATWPKLHSPVSDARGMHSMLRRQRGKATLYGEIQTELLDDTRGPVTAEEIRKRLRQIQKVAGPDDTVVLFFAGHGEADSKRGPGSFFFVCSDTDERKEQTKLSSKDLHDLLSTTQGRKVIFIDACRSGNLVSSPLVALNRAGPRLLIFSACDRDESALEPDPKVVKDPDLTRNGLFTRVVLEAVAAKGKRPTVAAAEIRAYLKAHLPALLKRLDQAATAQNPVYLFPDGSHDSPLLSRLLGSR